ncbi:MAG: phosphatase PAP2 family protein [Microthrixaceae bacterium]
MLTSTPVRTVDAAAARAAATSRGRGLDRGIYALSQAANHSLLWHAINAVDALSGDSLRRRRAFRRSAIIAAEQALVNGPIKLLVSRDRPVVDDAHPHALRAPRTSSFPSGHASAAACAATLLSRDLGGTPLWWGLGALVAWSRIHVGVHHASDVAAGLVVGRTLAELAGVVWPPPDAIGDDRSRSR